MSNRKPRILSINLHSENGESSIRAAITYDGLKGGAVDFITLSPKHAVVLAAGLVTALHAFVPEGGIDDE